ncbi:hypothetical protein FRC08_010759 [Ceratobasidium sp. 394]|nr:hypothetical protein FRC08_010759 [Ceratobasidium sp. 394]
MTGIPAAGFLHDSTGPGYTLAAGCTTDHIRLMVTLVQFLSALGSWNKSQMHALAGIAFTALACSKRNYSRWPQHDHPDEGSLRNWAFDLAMHYEHSPPSTDTQKNSLVTFGILEFLKHHAETLDENDLDAFINALGNYQPSSATIDIFSLPKTAFGSNYQYMIDTLTPFLNSDVNGIYAYSEAIRAACLSAFGREFFHHCSQTAGIYVLVLENLRSASSGLLKRTCCTLLASNSIWDDATLVGGLTRNHNFIPLCLEILHGDDQRVVPFIMLRLYTIIRLVNAGAQSLADKTTILQPLLSYESFLNAARGTQAGSYSLTLDTLERACLEAWLPRLEEMVDRILHFVDQSGIIGHIVADVQFSPQRESHPLYDRVMNLQSQRWQIPGDDLAADWS